MVQKVFLREMNFHKNRRELLLARFQGQLTSRGDMGAVFLAVWGEYLMRLFLFISGWLFLVEAAHGITGISKLMEQITFQANGLEVAAEKPSRTRSEKSAGNRFMYIPALTSSNSLRTEPKTRPQPSHRTIRQPLPYRERSLRVD